MSETAVVAIVGIAATLFVSRYVAWTQRLTAREDRLWTRRAATYVDLADWILRESQAAQLRFAKIRTGLGELMMPDALPDSAWWGMHARVIAFGTSNVRAVVDKLLHQRAAFASALAYAREKERNRPSSPDPSWATSMSEARDRLENHRERLVEQCAVLEKVISAELAERERPRRRWWPWSRAHSSRAPQLPGEDDRTDRGP